MEDKSLGRLIGSRELHLLLTNGAELLDNKILDGAGKIIGNKLESKYNNTVYRIFKKA